MVCLASGTGFFRVDLNHNGGMQTAWCFDEQMHKLDVCFLQEKV